MLSNLLIHVVEENGKDVQYFGSPDGGAILEVLLYALMGFAVTFLGIVLLIFLVWLVGKVIAFVTGKVERKSIKEKASDAQSIGQTAADGVSEEVRVAIIAAISAYYMSENSSCEFKVKRIKRL